MKILITGSSGFIGSAMLFHLKQKGYNVVGTTTDIRDKITLAPYFVGTEFVIHAAARIPGLKSDYYDVNVNGTKNVVELCLEYGCKLIHLSSTQRYTPYGRSKQEAQKMITDYANNGLKVVILRLCPIITKDNKLVSVRGRYYLEDLVIDIENLILNHDFETYKLINYGRAR